MTSVILLVVEKSVGVFILEQGACSYVLDRGQMK